MNTLDTFLVFSVSPARSERLGPKHSPAGSGGQVRQKIVVMGAAKVGKSSLISQFLYGTFSPKYKRTVEEMHHGDFSVAGLSLTLDILDTSGAYEFPAMRALSISSSDAFILVYDENNASTFEEVRSLRDQIHESKGGTEVPIVIVGNKVDLADEHREVSRGLYICALNVQQEKNSRVQLKRTYPLKTENTSNYI